MRRYFIKAYKLLLILWRFWLIGDDVVPGRRCNKGSRIWRAAKNLIQEDYSDIKKFAVWSLKFQKSIHVYC